MNIKSNSLFLAAFILLFMSHNASALSNGDSLQFGGRSNFSVDVGGWMLSTNIRSYEGFIMGQEQPASGSHSGFPDGSESPSIDEPWSFFANTGMIQTLPGSGGVTILKDDGSGNFELDFSGFGMTWNGIPNIPLGGDSGIPSDTGVANLSCSTPECGIGDTYTLEYSAHVPIGDPSGFGGVYFAFYFEGIVSTPPKIVKLDILPQGGFEQECLSEGGTNVTLDARVRIPEGDELESLKWSVDGQPIGNGLSVDGFMGLGDHNVSALLTTVNGLSVTDTTQVSILDRIAPQLTAEFIDTATGQPVEVVNKSRRITVNVGVDDVCDVNPQITYSRLSKNQSVMIENGDTFIAAPNGNTNIHQYEDSLKLSVTAHDSSNNVSSSTSYLYITD